MRATVAALAATAAAQAGSSVGVAPRKTSRHWASVTRPGSRVKEVGDIGMFLYRQVWGCG